MFRTDQSSVEVSGLCGKNHGYAVLANHSGQAHKVVVETTLPVRSLSQITVGGRLPLKISGQNWEMEIAAYDGAIVEWKLN
jgi:hypothetical protein